MNFHAKIGYILWIFLDIFLDILGYTWTSLIMNFRLE